MLVEGLVLDPLRLFEWGALGRIIMHGIHVMGPILAQDPHMSPYPIAKDIVVNLKPLGLICNFHKKSLKSLKSPFFLSFYTMLLLHAPPKKKKKKQFPLFSPSPS